MPVKRFSVTEVWYCWLAERYCRQLVLEWCSNRKKHVGQIWTFVFRNNYGQICKVATSSGFGIQAHIQRQSTILSKDHHFSQSLLGTVDNHGNTEIMETVIFDKCHECRDFAKMPCFLPKCQFLRFHKNILFYQQNLKFIVWI